MGAEICTDELKKLELAVLCYIREKCRENGLRYYMMYGTLIGAVRHKGFIPWDDDVDIAMFREDFMRLMHAVAADKESPYEVVSMYNVPDFAFPLAKVVDTRTSLVQHGVIGTHEKLGAYVDDLTLTLSRMMRKNIGLCKTVCGRGIEDGICLRGKSFCARANCSRMCARHWLRCRISCALPCRLCGGWIGSVPPMPAPKQRGQAYCCLPKKLMNPH